MIRVFPRRTKWTPIDDWAFVGDLPIDVASRFTPETPVLISVAFTWDKPEAERLRGSWSRYFRDVQVGGPAYDDPGGEFTPGLFVKEGMVITSRGCPKNCAFCLVPKREGRIRELPIKDGWNVSDNNLLACSRDHIEAVFEMLRRQPQRIVFSGGLDAGLLQPWHVDLLKTVRIRRMWFACDTLAAVPALMRAGDLLADFHREQRYCYVLVGFDDETVEEAERRLGQVYNLEFMPFASLYRSPEVTQRMHHDPAWRSLVRTWCNPARYKAVMRKRGNVQR